MGEKESELAATEKWQTPRTDAESIMKTSKK